MANPLRSFDLLLRLKRRRIDQLEELAESQAQQVRASQDELAQAEAAEQGCRSEQEAFSAKILAMLDSGQGFQPSKLVTMRHVLDTLADQTRRAEAETRQAAQRLEQARDALAQTRRAIQRAEQQLEKLRERREQIARDIELAQEDTQDEESEEAAVARLVAGMRDEAFLAASGEC